MPNDNKPNANPDGRPLPPGWITEYDNNYRAWFYVNTTVNPPVTTWVHPLVEAPSSNSYYGAPSGPPPDSAYGYDSRQGQYGSGYQPSPPPPLQQGYASSPSGYQQQQDNKGLFSSITGGLGRPSSSTQMLPGQTPPPQQSHNTGKLVGVGAAGLVGGVILGEMLEHHKDERHHHHGGGLLDGFSGGGFGGGPSFGGFGEGHHHHHHHEGGPGFGGFGGPGGGPGGGFGGW